MTIRRVTSPAAPEPPPERWSNCLLVDGIAYVSGMVARGDDVKELAGKDEYEQARMIFAKIKGLLEAAGGSMADVVKITVFVTNIKNNTKVWGSCPSPYQGSDFVRQTTMLHDLVRFMVALERDATAYKNVSPNA